jgi:phospholipid/cholesterol/gamma-HCH transport system substrate-binding protein
MYLLTGGTLLEQKVTLYLYISDATGVSAESPVRVDGIDVGVVKKVELTNSKDPNRIVRVVIAAERKKLAAISTDSVTQLSTDTLLGDKFVDISSGKSPDHIAPNGELHFRAQPDLMRTIDFTDFERQIRIVDATLADIESGASPLGQFVLTDTVYMNLRKKFIELQAAIADAKRATSLAGGLIYTDALYRQLEDPFVQLDRKLALLQSGQGEFGKLLRDPAQYDQTRASVQDLRKAIVSIRSADYIVSDSMYSAWNHTLAGLIQQVEEFDASPLFSSSQIFDNLNGAAGEMRKTVKEFREDPRKFLHLKVF